MNKSEHLITSSILRGFNRHNLCTWYPFLYKLKCASIANEKRPSDCWGATLLQFNFNCNFFITFNWCFFLFFLPRTSYSVYMIEQKNCLGYLPEGHFTLILVLQQNVQHWQHPMHYFQVMFPRIQIADLSLSKIKELLLCRGNMKTASVLV